MFALSNCKKKDNPAPTNVTINPIDPNNPPGTNLYVLVIDDGAQSMEVGKSLTFNAHLVSSTGAVVNPTGISWSSNLGGFSGSVFSATSVTFGIVTASVVYEGITYSASVPVNIQPERSTQLFAVVPSAIIWSTNSGPMQLNTVYLGSGSASYNFTSDNSSIASVSSAGLVTFHAVGSTVIRVSATINGQQSETAVPVMVVGTPEVPLPVTRIVVSPPVGELFRGETLQISAKAYNGNGVDVSNTVTFNYAIVPKQEGDDPTPPVAASIDGSGMVKALTIGNVYVKVTANGITGQAEIIVNPDTIITVTPFMVTLGTDYSQFPPVQNTDATLTATTQKVDRAKYKNHDPNFLSTIPNPPNLQWELPLTGIPAIDDAFKVVTLSNATNSSVKVTAIPNKMGATFIVAYAGMYGGGAAIQVNP